MRRERSSVPCAVAGARNTPRGMAFPTARPTRYSARAVFARPLERPTALRALKRTNLWRGASLARLLEMLLRKHKKSSYTAKASGKQQILAPKPRSIDQQ